MNILSTKRGGIVILYKKPVLKEGQWILNPLYFCVRLSVKFYYMYY